MADLKGSKSMVQDSPSRKMDQFIVRLPDGMRDRIKTAAEDNNRSMNAEIVAALEEKFPPVEPTFDEAFAGVKEDGLPRQTDLLGMRYLIEQSDDGSFKIVPMSKIESDSISQDSWINQADGHGDGSDFGYGDGTGDGYGDGAYGDSDGNGDGMGGAADGGAKPKS